MPHWKVDIASLHLAVETVQRYRRMKGWEVAAELGVPASTLTRLQQGQRLDVDAFASVVAWLNADPSRFIRRSDGSPPDLSDRVFVERTDVRIACSWAIEALGELPEEQQPSHEVRASIVGALQRLAEEVGLAGEDDSLGTFSCDQQVIHMHPRSVSE